LSVCGDRAPQDYGTQVTIRDGRYAPMNLRAPVGVDSPQRSSMLAGRRITLTR